MVDQGISESSFYTENEGPFLTLNLIFDNGIDPNPAFSGSILGKIHLDSKNALCLSTAPLNPENGESRTEVLLPGVKNFEFEFLGRKTQKKAKEESINSTFSWKRAWEKSNRALPSVIRLRIDGVREKEPLQFAIFLPSSDPLVEYREKKAR